jgi:rifampicin phosphotransferase
MKYVTQLEKIHQYDLMTLGGKAANLGELINAGLPVPTGFVVLTSAYESFVTKNRLQAEIERLAQTVSLTDPSTAAQAAHGIQEVFKEAVLPEVIKEAVFSAYTQLGNTAVAVRSSATAEDLPGASFAGLHETFLNVLHVEDLFIALRRCWSSLWTARALTYRTFQHIAPETVHMAVIVQQMVVTTASGVLFTCNPMTGAQDEMVINASWGLGEAIVSGHVSPDVVTIDKESGQVQFKEVAEKLLMTVPSDSGVFEQTVPSELQHQPVLSTEQIARLHQLGLKIENHFHSAQDIEWAIADNKLFVLQARPVTARPSIQAVTVSQSELAVPGDDGWDRQIEPQVQSYDLWTRTNLGENFPDPVSPLSATLWPIFFLLGRIPTKSERTSDSPPLPTIGTRFYGRIYVNEGAVIHIATEAGIPSSFLDTTWGSSGRGLRSSHDTFHLFRLLRHLPSMTKMGLQQARQQPGSSKQKSQKMHRLRGEQLFVQIDQWVDEFQQQDMENLDDRELWNQWMPLWIKRTKSLRSILVTAQLAALAFYLLERRVSKWTGKKGQATFLVQALSGVFTAEVGPALWRMAQILRASSFKGLVLNHPVLEALSLLRENPQAQPFITEFQAFLLRHGYRCPNDAELYHPRWAEAPEQVIELIKSYLYTDNSSNPVRTEQSRQQEREQLTAQIAAQLNPIRRRIFHWLLNQAQNKIRLRDNNRSYVAKFLFPSRLLIAELGQRWSAKGWLTFPDDIFFLTLYEIDDIVNSNGLSEPSKDLVTVVSKRREAFDYWHTIVAPAALGPGGIPIPDPEPTDSFLQGLPASSGRVRGTARLIRRLEEATRLSKGDILVTQATDPGWTPVFPLVSGLVLEVGGQLSHGAIIAREYGIPAVINVAGAMHFIQDGQTIEVDGSSGRVYLDITD